MPVKASEAVIAEMTRLCGEPGKAQHWYFNEPLREFDGKTAATLVSLGQEPDVLKLLEMYEAGSAG